MLALSARTADQYRSPSVHTTMPAPISSHALRSRPCTRGARSRHTTPAAPWTTSLAYLPSSEPLSGCEGIHPWIAYATHHAPIRYSAQRTARGIDTVCTPVLSAGKAPDLAGSTPDSGNPG